MTIEVWVPLSLVTIDLALLLFLVRGANFWLGSDVLITWLLLGMGPVILVWMHAILRHSARLEQQG